MIFTSGSGAGMGILIEDDGHPVGGSWSFDQDNRQALPKDVDIPTALQHTPTSHVEAVQQLVSKHFADHPGSVEGFNWPTTREQALAQLNHFCAVCLDQFGPYQDALTQRSDTVFHSLLTPAMNCGLLTADEVVAAVLARVDEVRIQSVEGFVRQVIGWREFIRGVYLLHHQEQWQRNHYQHQGKLAACWWDGTTGIGPLDDMIDRCQRIGYAHHIERLMVAGNVMVLAGVHPHETYYWFMEMFIDSADWVMGPNVFGMALFSDGGIFATKPYICASSYWKKQGYKISGEAADGIDGLYWQFVERNVEQLAANPRTKRMTWGLNRLKKKNVRQRSLLLLIGYENICYADVLRFDCLGRLGCLRLEPCLMNTRRASSRTASCLRRAKIRSRAALVAVAWSTIGRG